MKLFTRLKKYSSNNLLNTSKSEENVQVLPNSLDYFAEQSALTKMIADGQRQMVKRMGDRVQSCDSLEFDSILNDEFINDRALNKYGVEKDEFSLDNSEWFPRLRYHQKPAGKHGHEAFNDSISLYSNDSDFSHDGFAGPFSWETRSLQELEFPPTPIGERKLSQTPGNKYKMKKKTNSIDLAEDSHRTYETIEEIRDRLKKNYLEAKRQREKYLNLSANKPKSDESNLNGYRSKTSQQPVFKNYKQKSDTTPRTNGVVKFATGPDDTETFAAELSSALKRNNEKTSTSSIPINIDNIPSANMPRSPSGYSLKSNQKSSSGVSTGSFEAVPFSTSISSTSMSSHTTETPKSNRKSPGSSRRNSIKRNLSKRNDSFRKSPEVTRTDIDSVVANQNAVNLNHDVTTGVNHNDESVTVDNEDGSTQNQTDENDVALSNVMDMLANW